MPRKCDNCGADYVAFPISTKPLWNYTGETKELKSGELKRVRRFNWEALRWSNLRLRNLVFGDLMNIAVIVLVLVTAWAYAHDTAVARDIYERPCVFVEKNEMACHERAALISQGITNVSDIKINFNLSEEKS